MNRTQRIDKYEVKLDGRTELGDGSVRFNARLSRIGVFDYGDHKELRTEDEVFSPEAMASFRGVVVTDGHRGWVTPETWQELARGHVGDDVRRDGDYLVASVVVKAADMLAKIDSGERIELSMGYEVDLDASPGTAPDGTKYDAIQRNIRGNHAALGPSDWGRAGPNVRLLDGVPSLGHMTTPVKRVDAPSTTNDDQASKLDAATKRADAAEARADAAEQRADKADKRADAANARADKLEAERDDLKEKLDAAVKADDTEKKIDEAIALRDSARVILGDGFDFKGKTPRAVQEAALKKVDEKTDCSSKSDGYVEARFEMAVEQARKDSKSLADTNAGTAPQTGGKGDPAKKTKIDEAYDRADADARKAHEAGPPATATWVRK